MGNSSPCGTSWADRPEVNTAAASPLITELMSYRCRLCDPEPGPKLKACGHGGMSTCRHGGRYSCNPKEQVRHA